jgi:hypothetical protein
MMEYLLGLGVDVERINGNGQGCLHKAAQRCNWDVCQWLLKTLRSCHHFMPNKQEQYVPSRLAAISGDAKLAALLVERENIIFGMQSSDNH